jgi:D-glycero-alpha-D-manno-heptose-7-phosphate kinase
MQLDIFLIAASATLRDALRRIENNRHGMIFVTDASGTVSGVATDGDIRRRLLDGGSLDDAINQCANPDFVWESPATPRELLLKKLDHRIRVIPLLDSARRLVGLVSRDHIPIQAEGAVFARARAPVRISFGGGGSDLTHYFSSNAGGAVINTTISLYSHATLRIREDEQVIIRSLDLGKTLQADDLPAALAATNCFGLIQALLRAIRPEFGFELFLHSDFPMSSGLGGSAVVSASILGCFNQFRRDQWDLHELAEIAYQAERHYLDVAGGWQDQYATVFGGFNFMEFRMDQNIVHPLRIHPDTLLELEECLILCDTGTTHDSGDIHQDQRQQMAAAHVREMVETNVQLSYAMRNDLLRGRLLPIWPIAWTKHGNSSASSAKKSAHRASIRSMQTPRRNGATRRQASRGRWRWLLSVLCTPVPKAPTDYAPRSFTGFKIRPFRFEPQGLTGVDRARVQKSSRERIAMTSNAVTYQESARLKSAPDGPLSLPRSATTTTAASSAPSKWSTKPGEPEPIA